MLLRRIALLIFLFTATTAQARLSPQPGGFGFEGEWIYFTPSFDYPFTLAAGAFNSVVVDITQTNTFIGSSLANPFDHQSGFRVGAAYAFCECCLDFHIRWSRLLLENPRFIKGFANMQPLSSTLLPFNNLIASVARQQNTFDYHDVDGYFGVGLCCDPCFDLKLIGGLRYAQVKLKYETTYGGLTSNSKGTTFDKRTSCFWGIGPELGLDVAYGLGCGVSVTGRAEAGLLVTRIEGRKFIRIILEPETGPNQLGVIDFDLDPTWRLSPLYDLRLGLAYEYCCSWLSLSIEGGYEALSYVRALPIFEDSTNDVILLRGYSNADLHGPYINVSIQF